MNKKHLNIKAISNELEGASLYFSKPKATPLPARLPVEPVQENKVQQESTSEVTQILDNPRELSRTKPRSESSEIAREFSRALPTRDEIQGFSFRLRDDLKVKVQAEVPHQWQEKLEETARQLKVKKLELYRFIIGEFLGEVNRDKST